MKPALPHAPPRMKVAVVCMVLVSFVIIALGVGHIALRQDVIGLGYELSESHSELRELQEDSRKLRLERSVLTNPKRIRSLAGSLGMREPADGQVRIVRPNATELAQRLDPRTP